MTQAAFDQRLGQVFSSTILAAFLLSLTGRDWCAAWDEDPARFVLDSPGASQARSRSSAGHDLGRLLRTIEQLALDHVLVKNIG